MNLKKEETEGEKKKRKWIKTKYRKNIM